MAAASVPTTADIEALLLAKKKKVCVCVRGFVKMCKKKFDRVRHPPVKMLLAQYASDDSVNQEQRARELAGRA